MFRALDGGPEVTDQRKQWLCTTAATTRLNPLRSELQVLPPYECLLPTRHQWRKRVCQPTGKRSWFPETPKELTLTEISYKVRQKMVISCCVISLGGSDLILKFNVKILKGKRVGASLPF